MAELVGPPNPPSYPPQVLAGRPSPQPGPSFKDLWPVLAAQAADMASTEHFLGVNRMGPRRDGQMPARELNPLPGMQRPVGRLGWGMAETAAADHLTRKSQALRNMVRILLPLIHSQLAVGNKAQTDEAWRQRR